MEGDSTFDISTILSAVDGDETLAGQVIGVFLSDIPKQLADLDEAIAAGDAVTARRVAHSIKGAAATVGAEDLRAIAFEGETLGKEGRLDELKALCADIRARFDATAGSMAEQGFTAISMD